MITKKTIPITIIKYYYFLYIIIVVHVVARPLLLLQWEVYFGSVLTPAEGEPPGAKAGL